MASNGTNRYGEFSEELQGFVPSDAAVGDALPVHEWFPVKQFLRTCDQVALKHHANDASVSSGDLCDHFAADDWLFRVILVAVSMAAIDHDPRWQARVF